MLGWRASSGQTPAHHESCDSKVANKINFVHIILLTSGVVASGRILELILTLPCLWDVCTDQVAETIKAEVSAGLAVLLSSIEGSLKFRHCLLEWWSPLSSSTFFLLCCDVQGSHHYEKLCSLVGNGYSESYNRVTPIMLQRPLKISSCAN